MKVQRLLFFLFASFCCCNLFAQGHNTITVKPGYTIRQSIPPVDLYEYPQFTTGTVFFKNGKGSAAMNYNLFFNEIEFITPLGDTLVMANQNDIKFVNIGKDTFVYDLGFIKLLKSTADVKLGVKKTWKIRDRNKIGGYGVATGTDEIDNYDSYSDGMNNYKMIVMQELVLAKDRQYFIGDNYNHYVLANKKNLLKLFANQEEVIKDYLEENQIKFNNEKDLDQLVQFLAKL